MAQREEGLPAIIGKVDSVNELKEVPEEGSDVKVDISRKADSTHYADEFSTIPRTVSPDITSIALQVGESSSQTTDPFTEGTTLPETAIPRVFTSLSARDLDQTDHLMAEYDGKVKLITNVASLCNTTDTNYEELMQLYDRFLPQGFEVLGFPCRQFKEQEYRTAEEIKDFISNYNVSFPVFELTVVNGPKTHPIFLYCKWHSEELYAGSCLQDIEWNFGKFLLDRDNKVYKYYRHETHPLDMIEDIRKLLNGELRGRQRGMDGKFHDLPPRVEGQTPNV